MTYAGSPQDLPGFVANLAERLRALEARFLIQGPAGPIGPQGPGSFLVPTLQKVGSFVVTAGISPVASVAFDPLPTGLNHLIILWKARTSAAVTNQGMGLNFNSDPGANYYWQVTDSNNVTLSAAPGVGTTTMRCGIVPGANATASLFGAGFMIFPSYSDSHYQWALCQSGAPTALTAAGQVIENSAGFWVNNSPVNRVEIFPTAGGFITDSSFHAFGLAG